MTQKIQERPSWDEFYMQVAHAVSKRSSCDRAHVGAIIVKNNCIISQGYNGSIRGAPHCMDVGHLMDDGHCVRTIHAEANAIINAAANGQAIAGATLYVTHFPCWNCIKWLANARLVEVIYDIAYRKEETEKLVPLATLPITFRHFSSQ